MKKNLLILSLLVSVLMISVVSAGTLFEDGFESDDFSNWDEADNDWGISDNNPHSGSYAAWTTDSESQDDLRKKVSTIGYNNIIVSYWYKISASLGSKDHVYVQWYDGSTWHEITDYTSISSGDWTFESFVLPSGAINNPDFEIQFRSYYLDWEHCDKDLFKLDDVKVEGDSIGGCGDCTVDIVNPLEGEYYSTIQGDIIIDWTAIGPDCGSLYDVFYGLWTVEDGCDLDPFDWITLKLNTQPTYPWDISSFDESKVCVKIEGDCCDNEIEGPVYIDNIDPVADANGETCICEGDCCEPTCYEYYTCNEGEWIWLDASNSIDPGVFPSGIANYAWDLDDDDVYETDMDDSSSANFFCDDGTRIATVSVEVTDSVGNSDTDDSEVHIKNVAPTCDIIGLPSDVPLISGEAIVDFDGTAYDVAADLPKMTYSWDAGDSSAAETGNPTTHTYTSAGYFTVTLTVDDTDGGIGTCTDTIRVIDPIQLTNQEVAAFYPLVAEFNDGSANNKFNHGLSDEQGEHDNCIKVFGPGNLVVSDIGQENHCTIFWDRDHTANPTNDERGNHEVLFKVVTDKGDLEYYSFNVMVYSWIIDLEEGWNLVSIPLISDDSSSIANVLTDQLGPAGQDILPAGNVIYSYQFDGTDSAWLGSDKDGSGSLTDVKPGYGYWIKANADGKIRGFGSKLGEAPGMPPSVDVPTNDWSLIGRYGILGGDYDHSDPLDERVHGKLHEDTALDSLTKLDNDMHVYNEGFNIVDELFNNDGYWLWIEDNAFNNAESETYAPIDEWYPKN